MTTIGLGAVVWLYNLSTGEAEAGGYELQASLGCVARPCLNKTMIKNLTTIINYL
jgi:hypothetical protein